MQSHNGEILLRKKTEVVGECGWMQKFSDAHALGHKGIVHPKVIVLSVTLSKDWATPQSKKKKNNGAHARYEN